MIIWLRLYFWEDRGQRLSMTFLSKYKTEMMCFTRQSVYSVIFIDKFLYKFTMRFIYYIINLGNLDKESMRYGQNSSGNYNAWNVNSSGNVNNNNLTNTNSVRPAHYNLNDNMVKTIFLGR